MAAGTRELSIQDFLRLHALGDDRSGHPPLVRGSGPAGSGVAELFPTVASLRAEIERHTDRSMTVMSRGGMETITRCAACPKEETRPCMALRVLALPYAEHPGYRPEWRVEQADVGVNARQGLAAEREGVVPPSREAMEDLPPPGNARRRVLHQLGISFRRSDFTDEELAQRGIEVETPAGPPAD
jgi:hypothetical protein